MGHHTYPVARADVLEKAADRYRFLSRDELLWALDLTGEERVADLGSGTGFYTDDIAPTARRVAAVDVQQGMHAYYYRKGVPPNVDPVTAVVSALPLRADHLDAALSTMTFHEFVDDDSLEEVARVLRPGGRLVIADWTAHGSGEHGPPLAERFTADEAIDALEDHGFTTLFVARRPETFFLVMERQ